jgi:hypothetical protein
VSSWRNPRRLLLAPARIGHAPPEPIGPVHARDRLQQPLRFLDRHAVERGAIDDQRLEKLGRVAHPFEQFGLVAR